MNGPQVKLSMKMSPSSNSKCHPEFIDKSSEVQKRQRKMTTRPPSSATPPVIEGCLANRIQALGSTRAIEMYSNFLIFPNPITWSTVIAKRFGSNKNAGHCRGPNPRRNYLMHFYYERVLSIRSGSSKAQYANKCIC